MAQIGIYKKVVRQVWGKNRKKVKTRSKQKHLDKTEINECFEQKELKGENYGTKETN